MTRKILDGWARWSLIFGFGGAAMHLVLLGISRVTPLFGHPSTQSLFAVGLQKAALAITPASMLYMAAPRGDGFPWILLAAILIVTAFQYAIAGAAFYQVFTRTLWILPIAIAVLLIPGWYALSI